MNSTRFCNVIENLGFTLIELVVTVALFSSLLAFTIPSLLGARRQVEVKNTASTVLADIRKQQIKAMLGDTEGRATADYYGVHFENTSYTLFHGASYLESEPTNVVILLSEGLQFISTLPNSSIIFNKGNGEVLAFDVNAHSISLTNTNTNEMATLTFNTLGTATGVQ